MISLASARHHNAIDFFKSAGLPAQIIHLVGGRGQAEGRNCASFASYSGKGRRVGTASPLNCNEGRALRKDNNEGW
jgi:hypothetical protein